MYVWMYSRVGSLQSTDQIFRVDRLKTNNQQEKTEAEAEKFRQVKEGKRLGGLAKRSTIRRRQWRTAGPVTHSSIQQVPGAMGVELGGHVALAGAKALAGRYQPVAWVQARRQWCRGSRGNGCGTVAAVSSPSGDHVRKWANSTSARRRAFSAMFIAAAAIYR